MTILPMAPPRKSGGWRWRGRGYGGFGGSGDGASACMEGMLSTAAPVLAVMDADLQHDETILRKMFDLLRGGGYDVVVGTRNAAGGSMGEFAQWRV